MTTAQLFNLWSERVLLGLLLGLIALEVATLVGRLLYGPKVKTVSMVLRDRRYHLTGVVFALSAMPTHWWVPTFPTYVAGTVAFWLLALGLQVWGVLWWRRPVETWPAWAVLFRDPPLWVAAGLLAGLVLFPQGR